MDAKALKYFPVVTCVTSAILLAGFGLVCLYSALRGSLVVSANILNKQILLLVVSLFIGVAVSYQKEEHLQKFALPMLVAAFAGLILVLIPGIGVTVNGARRWLNLGISNFQYSELAKGLYLVGLAQYLSINQRKKNTIFVGFVVPMVLIVSFVLLLILEPDFGTAFLFGVVGVTMMFLWGARMDLLILSGLIGCGGFAYLIYNDPVRLRRITSFLDVEGNKSDGAYQLYQGLLAFGSGGVSGVGIGNGRQQLAFLPEAHTDFILSVIGEELGLLATFSIVALFAALFWSIIRIAKQTTNMFNFLVVVGGGSFIIYQCIFNIGVVTGLLPTKGISLPFISYGGANLVGSFFIIGLLIGVWRNSQKSPVVSIREL